MTFNRERLVALHEAMTAAGMESPYAKWLEEWGEAEAERDRASRVTTRVVCGDYFHVRDDALRAHETQVDPDGFWFRVPLEIQIAAWPTEDYELARSLVETTLPETDLFAGIREGTS
jgi:mycothiol S-conjugate amidase